ncbi:MAG: NADH-quinone oxidoreductase subunit K [Planctomycetes bacterium]|nr:NADH-quinone oxidoreductase subunit K [Planctomycetota bacterium]MCH9726095.1 NADH-quinone oxidoreductase subunit K [Planctomycetota bacterium]MCH9777247.1 NADH-quinone oxidoreductase subunit K [Planctomycetota bacterium]MCH9791304.1 NADH-quinone oxidoreductase subunit K [Planctomycetota bacterium]MDF1743152.1 NADH-quinone oxidoreductase subunit K [Gimesia sp.]
MLLSSAPLLHNNLLIAITLIVLGFLGMLLQRNPLAMVFSLLLWLQGAGLVFFSYSQNQGSRESQLYFLIILLIVMTLLITMAALIFQRHKTSEKPESNTQQSDLLTREGSHPRG